jgi:hypothetical protein
MRLVSDQMLFDVEWHPVGVRFLWHAWANDQLPAWDRASPNYSLCQKTE